MNSRGSYREGGIRCFYHFSLKYDLIKSTFELVTELLEFLHSVVFFLLNSSLKLNGTAYLGKCNRNDKLHFGYLSLMLVVLPIKGLEFYSAQRPKEKFVSS